MPRTIGLANGNFLTVWEDNTNGPVPFIDIMGQMFSAEGVALGSPFQVNSAITGSDETGPKIVAMPDGGYVIAHGSYLEAIGGPIGVERFDANGFSVSSWFITVSVWRFNPTGAFCFIRRTYSPRLMPAFGTPDSH
jgi:hypothetical protein